MGSFLPDPFLSPPPDGASSGVVSTRTRPCLRPASWMRPSVVTVPVPDPCDHRTVVGRRPPLARVPGRQSLTIVPSSADDDDDVVDDAIPLPYVLLHRLPPRRLWLLMSSTLSPWSQLNRPLRWTVSDCHWTATPKMAKTWWHSMLQFPCSFHRLRSTSSDSWWLGGSSNVAVATKDRSSYSSFSCVLLRSNGSRVKVVPGCYQANLF